MDRQNRGIDLNVIMVNEMISCINRTAGIPAIRVQNSTDSPASKGKKDATIQAG
jgi:hypothetical protein